MPAKAIVEAGSSTACTGSRLWHYPYDSGFPGLQSVRVTGSWQLLPAFQGECRARQFVVESKALQATPKRVMYNVKNMNLNCNGDSQEGRGASNVQYLLREAIGNKKSQPVRVSI